ncbi:hypothetical protein H5410_047239, partial [Solanum commersonii]
MKKATLQGFYSEDPKNFIKELKKIFDVMHNLVRPVKKGKVENAPPRVGPLRKLSWGVSFPELKETKFTQLSRYPLEMVADMRSRMSLFVAGLSRWSSKEGRAAMLIGDMDISRLMVNVQQKSDANRSSFQQKQKGPAPSSASAPAPKNKSEYYGQNVRVKPSFLQGSVAQGGSKPPACAKCGKNHSGICREGSIGCFKCGQNGHFIQECPENRQGNGGNRAQSSLVVPPDRTTPRGAISSTGRGANRLYAITSRHEQENSPNVVHLWYDQNKFDVLPERLCKPFCVSTPIGESILAER